MIGECYIIYKFLFFFLIHILSILCSTPFSFFSIIINHPIKRIKPRQKKKNAVLQSNALFGPEYNISAQYPLWFSKFDPNPSCQN
jgi:hypothetical protein